MLNLPDIWVDVELEGKLKVQKSVFPVGVKYGKSGFLNPSLCLAFSLCQPSRVQEKNLGSFEKLDLKRIIESLQELLTMSGLVF